MSDQNMLTLRHADQARADFALIESNLEFVSHTPVMPERGCLETIRPSRPRAMALTIVAVLSLKDAGVPSFLIE